MLYCGKSCPLVHDEALQRSMAGRPVRSPVFTRVVPAG